VIRIDYLTAAFLGDGAVFLIGYPEAMVGVGYLTAVLNITNLPPINVPRPPTFPLGHVFTSGDLTFQVKDAAGNPLSPFVLTYAIFQVRAGNVLLPFGDPKRRPVMGMDGQFYPSFLADDLGQPGDFLLRWTYQESFSSPPVVKDIPFRINGTRANGTRTQRGWF